MPLRPRRKIYSVKNFQGANNYLRDTLNRTEKGDLAEFCRFDTEEGSLTKAIVLGYATGTAEAGSADTKIDSFYRHYNTISSSPTGQWYAFCDGDYKTYTAGAWATDLSTAPTAGERGRFISYDASLYSFTKSSKPQKIVTYTAGTGTRATVACELGACYALLSAGGAVTAGAHYYSVTFTVGGVEVINRAVSNTITTAGGNLTIILYGIPKGPIGTTNRKIFRTDAGTGWATMRLVNTLADNITTTWTDAIADGAGAVIGAANETVPTVEFAITHKERGFYAGNTTYRNRLWYSTAYSMDYIISGIDAVPSGVTVTYEEIAPDDNDQIMQIVSFLNSVTILKKNSIRRLYTEGTASQWSLSDVLSPIGTVASDSPAVTPFGIIYLGYDGFYLFNGNNSQRIIEEFDPNNILKSRLNQCVAFYHKGKYHFAYPDASVGESQNNRHMIYDTFKKQMSIESRNFSWFSAANGEGDTGDLYYSDSQAGYIYGPFKATRFLSYRTETDFNTGSTFDSSYKMGTETEPKLQTSWDPEYETYAEEDGAGDKPANYAAYLTETYLTHSHIRGIYEAAGAQINAGSLGTLYWNEEVDATYAQDVEFYIRTAATQALVEDAESCTADNTTEKFTDAGHTLINTDRVVIGSTTAIADVPVGIDEGRMYYVVGVAGNDFQVSLTSGGAAVAFSDDGTNVTYKLWDNGPYTTATGSDISGVTAADWIQWCAHFISDTAGYTPYVYAPLGAEYAVKLTYNEVATAAETGLLMRWRSGWRELSEGDTILQKVELVYYTDATSGILTFKWEVRGLAETEGTMSINLNTYPKRFTSFFPLDAAGKEIRVEIQNSDVDSDELTIKECNLTLVEQPIII